MLSKRQKFTKRFFDLVLSIVLLPLFIPILLLLWILASIITKRNAWFVQTRIGYRGKSFRMFKIRSLLGANHKDALEIEKSLTGFGAWLRRTKLDELPQIVNVLKGEMSWVGPRPDIPGYADILEGSDRLILEVKPGITGPATIKYKNEQILLLQQEDPLHYNDTVIWPDKLKINRLYVKEWSFSKDIYYLWKSIFN